MNESFIVYNESAILNRLTEFPTTLVRLKRVFYVDFERQIVVKTTLRRLLSTLQCRMG